MRILIDVQTLYTEEKNRGIGLYTLNWLKHLIKSSDLERYYLMRKENDVWKFTVISKHINLDKRLSESQYWQVYDLEQYLVEKDIDIIHFTSPYMFDIELPNINNKKVKKSYLVYDLIPLAMKDCYYMKWPKHVQEMYQARSKKVKEADLILTISEASKQDIIKYLQIDPDKIKVVYASTDEELFKPGNNKLQKKALKEELGLEDEFVFSLTGYDIRKNNHGLIRVFSKIAGDFKDTKFIIGGIKQEKERDELLNFAITEGLRPQQILFLGFIPNDILVALYQQSKAFIFPTLYEGFGLPVLEALRCGSPVITSNVSSLPEITGDSSILVDPTNEQEIENNLRMLMSNPDMRFLLSQKGMLQAHSFSWDKVANESLCFFSGLVLKDQPEITYSKEVLAFCSPLNPQKSGISDYSEELLLYLKNYFEIKIIVKGFIPSDPFIKDNFTIIDLDKEPNALEYYQNRLYHVGNNEYHEWIIDALEKNPGKIVLHDLNLFGYFVYTTVLRGKRNELAYELIYNSGIEGEIAANSLLQHGQIPESQQFTLSNRIVDLSNGVIVHSNWVKSSIASTNNSYVGPIEVIPHGFTVESTLDEVIKLKNNDGYIKIGVFGNVIPNKRVDVIIKTIGKLVETTPNVKLKIVGQVEADYENKLKNIISRLKLKSYVEFIKAPELVSFKENIKSVDLCINLRWPTMGETSGTLMRALGYGIPCIVSNTGTYSEYPDDCTWKVDVDDTEEELLLAYLLELCNNPLLRSDMGEYAQQYIHQYCDFSKTAKLFKTFLVED